jgi:hypothetical protein
MTSDALLVASARAAVARYRGLRRHASSPRAIALTNDSVAASAAGATNVPSTAIVCQVLLALGFDEHRVFAFRLDHKLVEDALLADAGVPTPRAEALRPLLAVSSDASDLWWRMRERSPCGYVIKRSIGDGSGDRLRIDLARELLRRFAAKPFDDCLIQERVPILAEYREHAVEDDAVIEPLIFRRYSGAPLSDSELAGVATFVSECLDRFPDALVADTACGWDVAMIPEGWRVIEVNQSGMVPEIPPRYHPSGFFQDPPLRTKTLAAFLDRIEVRYGVRITLDAGDPLLRSIAVHRI